ncbi:MAG: glutamine--fructose-6-phosphate transaminase (isomerizing) [Bdellovibrionia bacterium]
MCGIVGYVGSRKASDILLDGLKRLEYRGYDSAGIALLVDGKIQIQKSEGRLTEVQKLFEQRQEQLGQSTCGIGHTRWATHGKPTTQNAHPHQTGHVVLVHNGIIENYLSIRQDLMKRGHAPQSETDSELFGFLVLEQMEEGFSLAEAVRRSFSGIQGQCSVVVMSEKEPGVVVGVRNGSPLVVALDPQGGVVFASDAQPLVAMTRDVFFLEHGDLVVATALGLQFRDLESGKEVERRSTQLDWSLDKIERGGYPHYMLKEIEEQPVALVDTLNGILDRAKNEIFSFAEHPGTVILEKAQQLVFVACGTSWHAALLGKYWIEQLAGVPVSVELASEFRYRKAVCPPGTVILGISQSGETADTLAVLRDMKAQKIPTLGISNVRGSSISREADAVFYTSAGPEIGVAATKTFISQLLLLFLIAGFLGNKKTKGQSLSVKSKEPEFEDLFDQLIQLPHLMALGLDSDPAKKGSMAQSIIRITRELGPVKGFFFIGRGYSFPVALEGALKLKEIAYDHAEGYAAGELKHGPIAMIDDSMVVVVLAPKDFWREKTVSNLQEVKARGARILGVGDSKDFDLKSLCDFWVPLPEETRGLNPLFLPFLLTPVVQLLSYHRAVLKGTDVDKPRNLAKSVTVE